MAANPGGVVSRLCPFWLISQFWQNMQRRLHQLKKIGYPLKAGQFKSFTPRLVRSKERQYDSNGLTDEVTG